MTSQSEETRHFSRDFTSGTKTPYLDCSFEDSNRLRRFGQESGRESQETNRYNVTKTPLGTSSRLASGSLSSFAEKSFPITRKGHFFSHYFFRDTREDFQKAVREILSRWGEKSCGDEMTSYRKLRARNMREDTQAVTSSEDERHYKFVIDVHDFMDVGEISVKAVNERELVVEGHLEKKEDGSKSSKRFLRRFVVPGDIELEAVISVMSSDGVLKILAPKKEGHNRKHFSIDVEDMDDVEATVSRKFRNGHRLAEEYLKKRDSSSDDEELRAFAKQSNNQYRVTFQDDDEEFEGGHVFNKETKMTNDSSKDFKYNIPSLSMETRVLHIERRGVFAEDYCFANVRNSFSQAVREVLEKASEWTCRSDAMHNYRRLRQRNLKLENQAVGILDDQDSHKIVMDVFDFMKGDVTVQLVKGKELLVEGQAERQDGGRVSRVSFVRRFALPELVERDAISCVLSSDGILTITCRKRASGYSARDFAARGSPTWTQLAGGRTRMRRTPSRIGKEPVLGPSAPALAPATIALMRRKLE
ncbi:heat shock protein 21 [Penaeus vannamei]|uniref:Heat shock protein 21 n=1 Tax=Penaeus vannamei TaxID=6689 RepID=A0A3R7PDJ7_PENVA|nr:heat shock protein 21 [Penaeus vannamei]